MTRDEAILGNACRDGLAGRPFEPGPPVPTRLEILERARVMAGIDKATVAESLAERLAEAEKAYLTAWSAWCWGAGGVKPGRQLSQRLQRGRKEVALKLYALEDARESVKAWEGAAPQPVDQTRENER